MKTITSVILFLGLLLPLLAENDFRVEDLPFYKVGQLEKEELYLNTAKSFISAKSSLEASKYITDTTPDEIAEFTKAYREYHKKRTGEVAKDLIIFGLRGNQFAHITMTANDSQSVCQMVWERTAEKPKVDWRATYGYAETSWEDFLETQPQTPTTMRFRIAGASYYNFNFSDDTEWACFKCFHPFLKKELFSYVRRDDPEFKEILEEIAAKGHLDITADLVYPEEVKDWKQVEISKVQHKTWYRKDYYNDN